MNSSTLLDAFRADVNDAVEPYLWSDTEVFDYTDDAQKMFTRLTGGISDATSSLTSLAYTAGTTMVPFSDRILAIRHISLASTGREIRRYNLEELIAPRSGFHRYGEGPVFSTLDNTTGPVTAVVLGIEEFSLRLVHIPTKADTLNLLVYRMPLKDITDVDQALEIKEKHHRALLLWMKYRAYSKQDAEAYDKGAADKFEAAFVAYCEGADGEAKRLRHKPRLVRYGGI